MHAPSGELGGASLKEQGNAIDDKVYQVRRNKRTAQILQMQEEKEWKDVLL
jgi:hypothetical protein